MRGKLGWVVVLVWAGQAFAAPVQDADSVVAEVIETAKASALNGARPNWRTVEAEAYALAEASPGEAGRTAAIRHVLGALKDGHSTYRPPGASPSPDSTAVHRMPVAVATVGDGGIAHLVINAWSGGNDAIIAASRSVREALNTALSNERCGLVLEISSNSGGNMWPMMGGIAPLYDEGTLLTFEARSGSTQVVDVRDGALRMNESIFPAVALEPVSERPAHIAVIIGPRTASSGEILALAFRGQANVRFFGQPTAGVTTGNRSIRLSNGGLLALTTSRIRDRSGHVQQGSIEPDVPSAQPADEAEAWLSSTCDREKADMGTSAPGR